MIRRTKACRYCGYRYEGRGIYADHGLAEHNLKSHEDACLAQQRHRAEMEARRQTRIAVSYRRRLERAAAKFGGAAPVEGQLGFPFDGVPAIVA